MTREQITSTLAHAGYIEGEGGQWYKDGSYINWDHILKFGMRRALEIHNQHIRWLNGGSIKKYQHDCQESKMGYLAERPRRNHELTARTNSYP